MTALALSSTTPTQGASAVDARSPITLRFDDVIDLASVEASIADASLNLRDGQSSVGLSWSVNAGLDELTLTPLSTLSGSTQWTLSIPTSLRDDAGNSLNAANSLSFTTALTLVDVSPRSGPVGTKVQVFGGDFGANASEVSLFLNDVALGSPDLLGAGFLEFTLPTGSTTGTLSVSVAGESAQSEFPFVVTLELQAEPLPRRSAARSIGLSIANDDKTAFLSNQGLGSISVYDLSDLSEIDTDDNEANGITPILTGDVPSEATLSPDGTKLLTLDFGTPDSPGDSFFVVDVASRDLVATIPVGRRPTRIAATPDESVWLVTNYLDDTLSIISTSLPYAVQATVPTGLGPNGVAVSPDSSLAFVCNYLEGSVSVIDIASGSALGAVNVGAGPTRALVSRDGSFVLVSCHNDNTLHIIETSSLLNLGSRSVFSGPSAMTLARDGKSLFLCSRDQDVVTRYSLELDSSGKPSLDQITTIATGRVPSAVKLTRDGSRLLVATEGNGGGLDVIFLAAPTHSITRIERADFGATTSADSGETLTIVGENFHPQAAMNRVRFGGVDADLVSVSSDRKALSVVVPVDAPTSADVVVSIGESDSNLLPFSVISGRPRALRVSPAPGAIGVSPQTDIRVTFSEAIRADAEDVRLYRLSESLGANGQPEVQLPSLSGRVKLQRRNRTLVFTPEQALVEQSNSNNAYRFVLRKTIADFAGNTLIRNQVIDFRLSDTRGPSLIAADFIDVDVNGVDEGDIINLVFDENVQAASLPRMVGEDGSSVSLNDSGSFGSGAMLERPNLTLMSRLSPPNQLRDLSRTISLRLGANPTLIVGGMNSAINALTNFASGGISDTSGNTGLIVAEDRDIATILPPQDAPRALSASLLSDDGDQLAEEGETIAIYCDKALEAIGALDTSALTLVGSGASFGSAPVVSLAPANTRVIHVLLGAGASFDFADAMSATPSFGIASAGGFASLAALDGQGLGAWAAEDLVYLVGENVDGPVIANQADAVVFRDLDANGVDAGDVIRVLFDQPLTVGNAPAEICFALTVVGDRFGRNAFIRASEDETLDSAMRARSVDIVLGANAKVVAAGIGSGSVTSFGSASSLDIAATIPQWAIADVFGLSARPDTANGPFDVASDDVDAPILFVAKVHEENNDGVLQPGESIFLIFNETILLNNVSIGDFSATFGGSALSFGAGAAIARGPNFPIDGQMVEGNSLRILLGTGHTVPMTPGTLISVGSTNPVTDFSGNALAQGSVNLLTGASQQPQPIGALLIDVNKDGVNAGDRLLVKMDQQIVLSGSGFAADAFKLSASGDDFGSGASLAIAVVDAELIALGLSNESVGASDPTLLEIVLGSGAYFGDLNANANPDTPSFIDFGGIGEFEIDPSTLALCAPRSMVFESFDLGSAFDDAGRTGSATTFNDVAFDFDGDGQADLSTDFRLPGAALSFSGSNGHFSRLVSTFNTAAILAGLDIRAFYNAASSEFVVLDNGEGLISSGAGILNGGDIANATSAWVNSDPLTKLEGLTGFAAYGAADIQWAADSQAPSLVSATLDQSGSSLTLLFDEAVQVNPQALPRFLFQLPVSGDRLGLGASLVHSPATPKEIVILLGPNAIITASGDFDAGVVSAASPQWNRRVKRVVGRRTQRPGWQRAGFDAGGYRRHNHQPADNNAHR